MRHTSVYLLVLVAMALLWACNREEVVLEDAVVFQNSDWQKDHKLHYQVDIEAEKTYSLIGILTTNGDYRAPFLGFRLVCKFSNGQTLFRQVDFTRPKANVRVQDTIMLRPYLQMHEDSKLDIEISLHSQYFNNPGIEKMDIKLLRR